MVSDFRKLNCQTKPIHFPLPDVDEHLSLIKDCNLFITLDLAHGYLQIPIKETSKNKTAIITEDETVEFNRLIFGLINGSAKFLKYMHKVLGNLRDKRVLHFLDDIFLPGKS